MAGLGTTAFRTVAFILPLMFATAAMAERYDCSDCQKVTAAELRHALDGLRKAGPLHVDVFTSFVYNRPVAVPYRAIEGGTKCTIVDRGEVEKFVELMSDVKLAVMGPAGVDAVAELRFYRADQGPDRPIMESVFDVSGPVSPAVINGHLAMVQEEQVRRILAAAADVTKSPGNRICASFKQNNDG